MRLIDADALRQVLEVFTEKDTLGHTPLQLCDAMPAASPWHRVEVEEPSKAGWYLVMDVDGDFNVDEWHNTFGWHFVTPSDADRITHWMPIEPPKEDA